MTVERLWPGSTVVCIGSGPSLTQEDVDYCRGRAKVIVVNDAYRLANWADALWACDEKWWRWHPDALMFKGLKYSLEPKKGWKGILALKNLGPRGLSLNPSGVMTGHNSGYQAINLAVLLGAKRIVLLGYDMAGTHYFGSHPDKSVPPFNLCREAFASLVEPLKAAGVEIVNCSRKSALTCFPTGQLHAALKAGSEVAA